MWPQSLENRAALRTALACVTAILLAFALHTDKPYWAGMTVVVVANLYTGSIIDKAIMRIFGTVIGAWFGFFIAHYIVNSFFLYFLINFFLVAVAVYYYNFSKYAYAYLLGAIGGFIVISELATDPTQSFWIAVWRPIEIGLGVLVSAAFAFCVFPNRIEDSVIKEIKGIFADMDALLQNMDGLLVKADLALLPQMTADNLQLKKHIRKAMDMLGFMRHEVGYQRSIMDRHRFLLDSCYSASRAVSYFLASNAFADHEMWNDNLPIEACLTAIRQDFSNIQSLFFQGSVVARPQSGQSLAVFDTEVARLPAQTHQQCLLLAHFLRQMTGLLCQLRSSLISGGRPLPAYKIISAQEQLRRDPDVIIHSIKAGLAAILALAFWLLSNWPGGLNGIVSSIVISIRRHLYEMHNISSFRLLGCVLGGGVAFVSLFFFSLDLYLFLLVIFFSVWAFSLFSFKQVDYAYIGLQANFALVIAMAQAGGPPLSMVPALERLGGVVIGIVASFLVANVLWRTNLLTMLQRQLQGLRLRILANARYVLARDKTDYSFYDLISASWLCRSLLDVLPVSDVQTTVKQQQIQQAREEHEALVLMQVTINNVLESVDQEQARRTAASLSVDLSALEDGVMMTLDAPMSVGDRASLRQRLREALALVMSAPEPDLLERENCSAYLYALEQMLQFRVG